LNVSVFILRIALIKDISRNLAKTFTEAVFPATVAWEQSSDIHKGRQLTYSSVPKLREKCNRTHIHSVAAEANTHVSKPVPGPAMDRNQEEAILQMVFGSSRPPHQIIVFAFCNLLGWTTQQIKDQLFTSTLSALLNQLEQQCSAKFNSPLQPFFEIMRERLGHTLDEELSGKTAREIYTDLLTHTAGMISLSEFTANVARRDYFNSWWRNIEKTDREDLHLVAKVRQGMEDAFAELNERHNHRLTGYIRPRVDNDSEVEDFLRKSGSMFGKKYQYSIQSVVISSLFSLTGPSTRFEN
jgi:hypothetical protein